LAGPSGTAKGASSVWSHDERTAVDPTPDLAPRDADCLGQDSLEPHRDPVYALDLRVVSNSGSFDTKGHVGVDAHIEPPEQLEIEGVRPRELAVVAGEALQ